MSTSPTVKKKTAVVPLISYLLFGLLSSLTLIESGIPSNASGEQSWSLASIFANIINSISPPKEPIIAKPSSLSISPMPPSATIDGEKKELFEAGEAIVGTTKMYSYTLNYEEEKPDAYDYDIVFSEVSVPGENAYTYNFNSGSKVGYLRIIPLLEGEYRFKLSDSSNHEKEIAFSAVSRKAPDYIRSNVEDLTLKIGESKRFEFSMLFGDMSRSDETLDRYLARYFAYEETKFTSSNPSIFTVLNGGVLQGLTEGSADLLFKGEKVASVTVAGNYVSEVARIELEASKISLSPLDYDYFYGAQINVRYFNSADVEIPAHEPINFVSSDFLIASVNNDHLEVDSEGNYIHVPGGFVSGYRKKGNATIEASLLSNPSIKASLDFSSSEVLPSNVTISASVQGKPLSSDSKLIVGDTISLSATFEPKNASSTALHVEADPTKLKVLNNDTNNPSLQVLTSGEHSFSVYSISLGENSKVSYSFSASDRPVVDTGDMADFHTFVRKAAGHFMLFFLNGIFASFAFLSTLFKDKKRGLALALLFSILVGFFIAGLSELIQAIPSLHRGSTWSDVGIDTLGFAFASAILFLIFFLVKQIRKKKN